MPCRCRRKLLERSSAMTSPALKAGWRACKNTSRIWSKLFSPSGRVAALEMELKEKLSAGVTYRLRFSEQRQCLGVAAETQSPVLVACDKPNSWTLLVGVPINKREDPASTNKLPPVNSGALPPEAAAPTPVKSCQSLDKDACVAHPESCFWRTENNKCGRKKSENQANQR